MHQELFEELKKEHAEVKGMLKKMEDTSENAIKTRSTMIEKLRSALIPHMRGEEQGLYALLKEQNETKENALEAFEEHHVARIVLHELEELSPDHESWSAKQTVLSELIDHHVEEEESEIFNKSREVLSQDQARIALEKFHEAKKDY